MTAIEKIIAKRLEKFNKQNINESTATYKRNQGRLKVLVERFGVDIVAQASELTVGTVRQYVTLKFPPPIKSETVDKAEIILEGL
mgnify:CR=1 FL=1